MPYVYQALQRKEINGQQIPVLNTGEALNKWRWIAGQAPYWYFESDVPLTLPKAPDKYPNGVPVWDKGLIEPFQTGEPVEIDKLAQAGITETDAKVFLEKAGYTVTKVIALPIGDK